MLQMHFDNVQKNTENSARILSEYISPQTCSVILVEYEMNLV